MLAGATGLRAWLAYEDHSIFWPDEIYQSLEQAHRAAFGYGMVPWEFRDGARSWLFPGVIAGLWKLAAALGIDSSLALILLARLSMVGASVTAIWFAARLASVRHGARAALATAVILATFPPGVVFAYRAMSETASAPLIALAAWLLSRRSDRAALLAGLAIALGSLLRYQNGLFAIVFAIVLVLQRRHRQATAFCAMGVGVALLGGLLDYVTWGRFFHSLLAYVDFNLVLGGASEFGIEPFSFYAASLWSSVGPALLPLMILFLIGAVADPILGGIVAIYTLAHCVLPHKELRFLVPCFPMFATVAGIGAERVIRRIRVPNLVGAAAGLATTLAFGYALVHLDYQSMGQYAGTSRASLPVWKTEQEASLLLADAGQRGDLCGLSVLGARAAFTGAYTYLHRDVPLIYQGQLCNAGAFNYIIRSTAPGAPTLPASYELQLQQGTWGLYRRPGGCQSLPHEQDRLLEGAQDMGLGLRQAKQASDHSLRFDLERDSGAFVKSWGHGELQDCEVARWATGKVAAIAFDFAPAGMHYQLNFRARPHDRALPQGLAIAVNGSRVRVGGMSSQLKSYSIDLPDDALRAGRNRLEFLFSRAVRAGANDRRELTALFRAIEIVPRYDDFSIDVATSESRKHLVTGFSEAEREGDIVFAWSDGPRSEIEGTLVAPRSPYILKALAEAVPLVRSQRTRVVSNDKVIGILDFSHTWQAHELLIPAYALRKGSNRIRFEYESAVRPASVNKHLSDQRELGVRFRSVQLTPLQATPDLDIGTTEARRFMTEGWSGDERDGERTAVWSDGPRASVVLSFNSIAKPILRLSAQGYGSALPINVDVAVNGTSVGTFAAPDGWQNISVPLPASVYSAAGELITFSFDHTLRPSARGQQNTDKRELALRVDRVWVDADDSVAVADSTVRALRAQTRPGSTGIAASR